MACLLAWIDPDAGVHAHLSRLSYCLLVSSSSSIPACRARSYLPIWACKVHASMWGWAKERKQHPTRGRAEEGRANGNSPPAPHNGGDGKWTAAEPAPLSPALHAATLARGAPISHAPTPPGTDRALLASPEGCHPSPVWPPQHAAHAAASPPHPRARCAPGDAPLPGSGSGWHACARGGGGAGRGG